MFKVVDALAGKTMDSLLDKSCLQTILAFQGFWTLYFGREMVEERPPGHRKDETYVTACLHTINYL